MSHLNYEKVFGRTQQNTQVIMNVRHLYQNFCFRLIYFVLFFECDRASRLELIKCMTFFSHKLKIS